MKASLPITAIAALVVLTSGLTQSVKVSLADDGKLTFGDMPNFVPVWPKVVAFAPLASELPKQIADIDAEEASQIKEIVAKELGVVLDDEKLLLKVNASLDLIHSIYKTYEAFKA